jgi:hypothetical protein
MMEKEKLKLKETQDKLYDERAAKLWELEYQKKINDQKEIHLKKVILCLTLSCKKLKEGKSFKSIKINYLKLYFDIFI